MDPTKKAKPVRGPVAAWARRITFGVAAAVSMWVADNVALREPVPAPLFRESDLPPVPEASANGWTAYVDADAVRPVSIPPDLLTLTAARGPIAPPRTWADVIARKDALAAFLATREADLAAQTMLAAIAKPTFADACPRDIAARCAHFALFRAHQTLEISLLHRALQGQRAEALRAAARLVRADASNLASSRSLISQSIALGTAERAIELVSLLLAAPGGDGIDPAVTSDLRAALDALPAVDLRLGVIGEYLLQASALTFVVEDRASGAPARIATALFLDRGQTLRFIADRFEPAIAHAKDANTPAPAEPTRFTKGAFWWFHNPVGKLLADTTAMSPRSLLAKAHEQRAAIARRRDEVRARLGAR